MAAKKTLKEVREAPVDEVLEAVQEEQKRLKSLNMKFTGATFSFVYRPHNGFADFAIVKMHLKEGVVVSVEDVSDPYTAMEARARMEMKQAYEMEKMQRSYPEGYQHV